MSVPSDASRAFLAGIYHLDGDAANAGAPFWYARCDRVQRYCDVCAHRRVGRCDGHDEGLKPANRESRQDRLRVTAHLFGRVTSAYLPQRLFQIGKAVRLVA